MKSTKRWRPARVGPAVLGAAFALAGCGGDAPAGFRALVTEQPGILLSAAYTGDGNATIAGGQIAGGGALLLRWDGRSMTTVPTPGAHAFWWVHALSPTELYLAGESGEVHRFDGASLTVIDAGVPATATLFGIWGPSGDELWTVGGSFSNMGAKRIIRHLTAGKWTAVESPADVPAETTYFKVWGADASDVWIVGDGGVVLHWDGSTLSHDGRVTGAERFFTVHGCDRQNVWVVGGTGTGEVRSFDGKAWTSVPVPGAQPLNGVGCAGGDVIVGGAFGYAARIAGGMTTAVTTPREVGDLFIHGIARTASHTLAVGGDLLAGVGDPYRGFVLEL